MAGRLDKLETFADDGDPLGVIEAFFATYNAQRGVVFEPVAQIMTP